MLLFAHLLPHACIRKIRISFAKNKAEQLFNSLWVISEILPGWEIFQEEFGWAEANLEV